MLQTEVKDAKLKVLMLQVEMEGEPRYMLAESEDEKSRVSNLEEKLKLKMLI